MTMRNPLILVTALTAALAAPLAFAQDANASATAQEHAAAQASTTTPAVPATTPAADAGAMAATPATPATPPTGDTSATGATPATPATPSAAATKKISWSDLDGDKDGKLSKTEAAPISSLSQVFDQADSDKDGALTADEYKAYIAAQGTHAGHGNNG